MNNPKLNPGAELYRRKVKLLARNFPQMPPAGAVAPQPQQQPPGFARGSSGVLSTKQRKALPRGDFAIPSKAPGSGSYPINNPSHARNALARASGKPVEAQVRAAVRRKYPNIG